MTNFDFIQARVPNGESNKWTRSVLNFEDQYSKINLISIKSASFDWINEIWMTLSFRQNYSNFDKNKLYGNWKKFGMILLFILAEKSDFVRKHHEIIYYNIPLPNFDENLSFVRFLNYRIDDKMELLDISTGF